MKLSFSKREKGFTLIELIIVLAVLGVLASIVAPNVVGYLGQSKERAWQSDQRTLHVAVAGWRGDVTKRGGGDPWPTIGSISGSIGGTIGDPVDANADGDFMDAGDTNTFIDISELADENYLNGADAVKSAFVNATHLGTTNTNTSGSYAWYIDSKGRAQSWYPFNDTLGTPGAVDIDEAEKGYQTGVYP